jgi:hypothetical protein
MYNVGFIIGFIMIIIPMSLFIRSIIKQITYLNAIYQNRLPVIVD